MGTATPEPVSTRHRISTRDPISTRPRRFRRNPRPAVLGVVLLAFTAVGCSDAELPGDGVMLRPGGDVLAAMEDVVLTEGVPGDAMAAGRSVSFDGTLGGSYLGAGGEQTISGRIDGSVRAAGGRIAMDAAVGRNLTIVGGTVEIGPEAVVDGNAYLGGGTVRIRGRVVGDVYVGASTVDIDGDVEGDLRVEAATLTVGPDARIDGEVRYRLEEGRVADISADARLAGGTRELEPREPDDGGFGFTVLRLMAFLLAGAVLVALFPTTAIRATQALGDRVPAALGLGVLWVLLAPLGVVILAATAVGIPLALMVAVLYVASLYLAPAVTGLWLGEQILQGRSLDDRGDAVLAFALGGAIVAVVLLLPWVGFLARLVATCFGLGLVVLWIRERTLGPAGP